MDLLERLSSTTQRASVIRTLACGVLIMTGAVGCPTVRSPSAGARASGPPQTTDTGTDALVVDCIDIADCTKQAADKCKGDINVITFTGREYRAGDARTGRGGGAVKQMLFKCGRGTAEDGSPRSAPPTGAAGFLLDAGPDEIERTCRKAGHDWNPQAGGGRCAGLASDVGIELDAYATFEFCDGKACTVSIKVRPGDAEDTRWMGRLDKLLRHMMDKYGDPRREDRRLRTACDTQVSFCTRLPDLHAKYTWTWTSGYEIVLEIASDLPRGPMMTLSYASPARTRTTHAQGL